MSEALDRAIARMREQALDERKPLLIVALVWSFAVWHFADVSDWLTFAVMAAFLGFWPRYSPPAA
jgi:hypothetical protein